MARIPDEFDEPPPDPLAQAFEFAARLKIDLSRCRTHLTELELALTRIAQERDALRKAQLRQLARDFEPRPGTDG